MKLKYKISSMLLLSICILAACSSNINETQEISINCISADGGTAEFDILNSDKFSLLARNNANFEIEIKMQKKDLFGNWKDMDLNNKKLINILRNDETTINSFELNRGTYKFQANGSYGDNYNYDIKLSLIDN